jgi:CRISPR-associated protein Cas5t
MIFLEIEVPNSVSFAPPRSKESCQRTYFIPPPSTVYGCLMSYVGEFNMEKHFDCKVTAGIIAQTKTSSSTLIKAHYPEKSTIFYKEEIFGNKFLFVIDSHDEKNKPSLEERIIAVFENPSNSTRKGPWCLGKSSSIINSIHLIKNENIKDYEIPAKLFVLDKQGDLSLTTSCYFWKKNNNEYLSEKNNIDYISKFKRGKLIEVNDYSNFQLNFSDRIPSIGR